MNPRRLYLIATSSWFLAFGMQSVVFAWLVTIVLEQPAELVGWAQTALLVPGMLFILLAGAFADRVGQDRQAMWAQGFAAITPWILIVALQMGVLSYSVMVVYAVLMGVAQAFVTPARDGLLNHVAQDRVQQTVLLASLCQFFFQIIGYTLAGYADRVGAPVILGVQSGTLLFGLVAYGALYRQRLVKPHGKTERSVWHDLVEGAKTVAASPVMRVVVLQNVAMACFFMGCFIVCFPLAVREVFDGSAADLAWLNAINSLGLVLTILLMLRVGYLRFPGRALLLAQGFGAMVLGASGMMDSFVMFVVLIFCWGLCGGIAMPMSRTIMQELAPPAQRARVMSFYSFSLMGSGPLGTLFCGYLSAAVGPQYAIQICGAAMLSVVIIMTLTSSLWQTEFKGGQPIAEPG